MKQKFYPLLFGTLMPFIVIIYFYRSTTINLDIAFTRVYQSGRLQLIKSEPINLYAPTKLVRYGNAYFVYDLSKNTVNYAGPSTDKQYSWANRCTPVKYGVVLGFSIDSSGMHVIDGRQNHYLHTSSSCVVQMDSIPHLERGIPVGSGKILAVVNAKDKDIDMVMLDSRQHSQKQIEIDLSRYKDGGFGNDGVFSNSNDKNKICYMLYHIGKFYVVNMNAGKAEGYQTIDKYTMAPEVVRSGSGFALSRKTVSINRIAANDDKFLFLVSNIKSREDKRNHVEGDIIDVYSMNDGRYLSSIAVEGLDKEHIVDLNTENKGITILTKKRLLHYAIK